MASFVEHIQNALRQFTAASAIDIIILAAIVYFALLLMRGTTAVQLVRGIVILLLVAVALVRFFDLKVLEWVMRNSFPAILIAIPIIFQPEIRRFLRAVGAHGPLRLGPAPQLRHGPGRGHRGSPEPVASPSRWTPCAGARDGFGGVR